MNRPSLNQFQLKMLAVICMLIDHIGYAFFSSLPRPAYLAMRIIGRTAFPIFAFMLVEGFIHTRSRSKHLARLAVFALLSEIPFNLIMDHQILSLTHQSVILTLFLAFAGLMLANAASPDPGSVNRNQPLEILGLAGAVTLPFLADYIHTDYGSTGVITVYLFYLTMFRRKKDDLSRRITAIFISLVPLLLQAAVSWKVEYACLLALPFLALYDGEQGRNWKYFFYLFYPAHFLVIVLCRTFLL